MTLWLRLSKSIKNRKRSRRKRRHNLKMTKTKLLRKIRRNLLSLTK